MRSMVPKSIAALCALAMIAGCDKPQPTAVTPPQPQAQAQIDTAEIIYVGGDIVTIHDRQPSAGALAVKGGTILAVGARGCREGPQGRKHAGRRPRRQDADA